MLIMKTSTMCTQKISFQCHSSGVFPCWLHSLISTFAPCTLFKYNTVLKKFLTCSLKACKQFVKIDENASPILTKTDRNPGMYFVYQCYLLGWV
jgi:hypothetical protein